MVKNSENKSREELILNNFALVHSIAKRFKGRGADYDDLYQAGCLGLVKAADNFDESRGFKFSTYAVPVIMGEIKRIFRDGGQIRVSRSLKEKSFAVQSLRDKFINENNREPTVSELAKISGCGENELCEILNAVNPVVSLTVGENDEKQLDIPDGSNEAVFDKICVRQALTRLKDEDRRLISYRFFEGKTQTRTASLLGISQVQVSRREKAILSRLRNYLS